MTDLPIAFRSNRGRYAFSGSPSLENCYAEQQGNDAKAPLAILPSHGLVQFSAVTDSPCRGLIFLEDANHIYSVHESSLYKISSAGTATRLGTIPGIDTVQMVRNRKSDPQLVIKTNAAVYFLNVVAGTLEAVTDTDLPTPVVTIGEVGGFIIYGIQDGRFYLSELNDAGDVDALDFAEAEATADRLVRIFVQGSTVYFMGQRTIEPWRFTGGDFPLTPDPNVIPVGILAGDSAASVANTLTWVGSDGIVYQLNGYTPNRISNGEVERAIKDDTSQSSIVGFAWTIEGHQFYNITGQAFSYTYDATTQTWHRRRSYTQDTWRALHSVSAFGQIIVGDKTSGALHYLNRETYTEAGEVIIWKVRSPRMHAFPNGAIVDSLYLDMQTGVGVADSAAQGFAPKVMLSWSNDGGTTFQGNRQLNLGAQGSTRTRLKTNRLGRIGPQGRDWELSISDPVARGLLAVDAKVRPLRL
jgi:hypothetical protein